MARQQSVGSRKVRLYKKEIECCFLHLIVSISQFKKRKYPKVLVSFQELKKGN